MARRGTAAAVVPLVAAAVVFSCLCQSISAFNITAVLTPYPSYTLLNQWLTKTGVADEVLNRSTLTVLAPNNNVFQSYLNGVPNAYSNPDSVGDTLRYHILLTYYGIAELKDLSANGTQVTTLLQTTGRANESQGFVKVYNNGSEYLVGHEFADSYGNETILGNLTQSPYVYSVLEISSVLVPAVSTPSPAPAPSPRGKAPSPSPSPVTAAASAPKSESKNHANMQGISQPLVLLAMLLPCILLSLL